VQATFGISRHLSAHIERVISAMDSGSRLLVPVDPPAVLRSGPLPALPPQWVAIGGSASATAAELFIAYANDSGAIATLQAVGGADLDPIGRLIALVTLGGHRVSVAETNANAAALRFEARWGCTGVNYRLAVGPATLGEFMALLLGINWSE
jgi:hypothetical protein